MVIVSSISTIIERHACWDIDQAGQYRVIFHDRVWNSLASMQVIT